MSPEETRPTTPTEEGGTVMTIAVTTYEARDLLAEVRACALADVPEADATAAAQRANTRASAACWAMPDEWSRDRAEVLAHAVVVADRPVGAFEPIEAHPGCGGHSVGDLVGYAVRETIGVDGPDDVLRRPDGRIGYDVAVIVGPGTYGEALEVMNRYRADGTNKCSRWAVVDRLYRCGHRS